MCCAWTGCCDPAPAAAAPLFLEQHRFTEHQMVWWEVPAGTAPSKAADTLTDHLHRSRPRGEHPVGWLQTVLAERHMALLVVSGAHRLQTGSGSRTIHHAWNTLIRRQRGMLTVLLGEGLLPGLFRGAARAELQPYMFALSWERLAGQWGRDYPLIR